MKIKTEISDNYLNVWVLAISVTFSASCYTMLLPFLPMYLLEIGVSKNDVSMWAGIIFSVTFFIGAIMAPFWGKLADKKGKKLMAIRAGFCICIVDFLGAFVVSPEQLLGVRILQGFASGFIPACLAIASSSVPKEELGFGLGLVQTGQIVGTTLGPLLGGSLSHVVGMRFSFILAGSVLFVITLAILVLVHEPKCVVENKKAVGNISDDLKYAVNNHYLIKMLVTSFTIYFSNMLLQSVISLYVAKLQETMDGVILISGIVLSLSGMAGVISTLFWGKFGQSKGYDKVLIFAFCGAGLCSGMQYFSKTVVEFGILQFIFGLFFAGANPSVSAIMVNCTDPSFRGRMFGLATMMNQTGSMLGPLIGSFISMVFGIQYAFIFTGGILFLIGIFLMYIHIKANRVCG